MASIYQLNQPPNPFWDFLNGNLEDHPFFAPRGHHGRRGHHSRRHGWENSQQSETVPQGTEAPNAESNGEMKNDRSASDSDSPDNQHRRCDHCGKGNGKGRGGPGYGPGPFRGMGGRGKHEHCPHAGPHNQGHHCNASPFDFSNETAPKDPEAPQSQAEEKGPNTETNEISVSDSDSPGNRGPGRKCKNKGHGGPGPFRGKGGKCKHGRGPHAGPWGHHNHPYDHAGMFGGRGRGPHHTGGHGKHHGGPPFGGQGFPFNFLRNLGIPMNESAPEGVDFTPAIDVFDTPAKYMVHVSLPGAKKSDLSIDYDADESVLRLAGVVHRPGVDENMYQGLAMEERGREVGVFEREVRFGTRAAPAFVAVEGISAKLEDGVLNVVLPKVVPEPEVGKKKVVVKVDDLECEKGDMVDEKVRGDFTPDESEVSDVEDGEAREYVKVPVL
ncbi:uncharacterized protein N7446_010349 [Penicillium canescens]|uniref:SHSP domain-containing protein n=1 Tax=Penicillium canescens TaxID=5083 RepID=A0AAD6N7H0_PENCN|nr:uncharacterized protein N7446_010349 [Penicillium canescens]KAJ6035587.1 hypothetical protein N7460_009762 [Penicillium canescens]KAJ6037710.1 hypothetical protein N7444_010415 [Penicillium canescens]KAJ6054337.1 hypothetical protein N7446_010349 [Penicillium canescens]